MLTLPDAISPLAAYPQWIHWRAEWDPARNKWQKIPEQINGYGASTTNPAHWATHAAAAAALASRPAGFEGGLAFVFADSDPFFFLDIDNCGDGAGGWSQHALTILGCFPGCAVEVSHSGSGLHVFGSCPPGIAKDKGRKNAAKGLEFYTRERFVAFTGNFAATGSAATAVDWRPFVATQFPETVANGIGWTTEPVEGWKGPEDDDELIRRMMESRPSAAASLGNKPTIQDYWHNNVPKLAAGWPHATDEYDRSQADSAFATLLAFWTGKDCERMERLMRRSAMVRDKWDRDSYLTPTIINAANRASAVYVERDASPAQEEAPAPPPPGTAIAAPIRGQQSVCHDFQFAAHFEGCVYVVDRNMVFDRKYARLMDQGRFNAVYGGFKFFLFPNGTAPARNAWEAFLQSSHFHPPIVASSTFQPSAAFGEIVTDSSGLSTVNVHQPYSPPTSDADASPFVGMVKRMFPNERDHQILFSYMAALLQHPGVKFRWWPVIQGVKGSGKSLLGEIMKTFFKPEYRYVAGYDETKGDSNHNAWIENKLFIVIEEIDQRNRSSFMERLKEMVANNELSVNPKGVDQRMVPNFANGLILTNHAGGVPVDDDERRYAMLTQAQQRAQDLKAHGMTEDYFLGMDNWLRREGGFAAIAGWLMRYQIPDELNPATRALRAPRTTTWAKAVNDSLTIAEQEVVDAIEEGRPGFRGGWVSGHYMAMLMEEKRIKATPRSRDQILEKLGFIRHPALVSGRPNSPVMPDNKRSVLYVRAGHPVCLEARPVAAAEHYSKMQLNAPVATDAEIAFISQ